MDLASTTNRLLDKVYMLQHSHINCGNFTRMVTPHNVIHFIQRCEVIIPSIVTIADSQSFVRMYIEESEFPVR
jgi:hypothetical protein